MKIETKFDVGQLVVAIRQEARGGFSSSIVDIWVAPVEKIATCTDGRDGVQYQVGGHNYWETELHFARGDEDAISRRVLEIVGELVVRAEGKK